MFIHSHIKIVGKALMGIRLNLFWRCCHYYSPSEAQCFLPAKVHCKMPLLMTDTTNYSAFNILPLLPKPHKQYPLLLSIQC